MTDAPTWTVRDAIATDLEQLTALHCEMQGLHHAAEPTVYRPADAEVARAQMAQRMQDADIRILVATECDGPAIVGHALLVLKTQPGSAFTYPATALEVDQLGVSAPHRRRGVGRALLQAARAWGREHGATEMRLSVRQTNTDAAAAYARLGFQVIAARMSLAL